MSTESELIGKSKKLDDGSILKAIQIKEREDGLWMIYTITYYNAIPKKLMMPLVQFKQIYGTLS